MQKQTGLKKALRKTFLGVLLLVSGNVFSAEDLGVYKKTGDVELKMLFDDARGKRAFENPSPAVIFFFGGGWNNGEAGNDANAKQFSKMGLPVFHPEYRVLSKHGTHPPDAMADAADAVRWVRANADKFNIDPERLIFAGFSAGGHLAASLPIAFDGVKFSATASEFKPMALVLISPVTDATENGYQGKLKGFLKGDVGKNLSPVYHLFKGYPKTLIFHGDKDTTAKYPNTLLFEENMKSFGNEINLQTIQEGDHFLKIGNNPEKLDRFTNEVKKFLEIP